MKLALVVVAVCSSFAVAEPVKIIAPAGWTEGTVPEQMIAGLKNMKGAVRADGRMWRSDAAALTLLDFEGRLDEHTAKEVVEGMEYSADQAMQRYTQISRTRTIVNHRLVIDAKYEASGRHLHVRRIYAVDDQRTVYAVAANCVSSGPTSPECDAALDTIDLPVKAVWIEDVKNPPAKSTSGYLVGKIIGVIAIAALFVVLVIPRKRKKKR
jgi:hypothetical protein